MIQRVGITIASYKLAAVCHVAVLYVKAVQKSLAIEPVVEGSLAALEPTRPIPNQGPSQPRGEVTFHLSAYWLRLFVSRLEQTSMVLFSGHDRVCVWKMRKSFFARVPKPRLLAANGIAASTSRSQSRSHATYFAFFPMDFRGNERLRSLRKGYLTMRTALTTMQKAITYIFFNTVVHFALCHHVATTRQSGT